MTLQFSARMMHKRGRAGDRMRRCRQCVLDEQAKEAKDGTAAAGLGGGTARAEPVTCTNCEQALPAGAFSRSQLNKLDRGESARCLECVAEALAMG